MISGKKHIPVLLKETINLLDPKEGGVYADGTVGFGGHAEEILKKVGPRGRILAIDKDSEALKSAKQNLRNFKDAVTFVNDDFQNLEKISKDYGFDDVDGIILDLGVSSYQFDEAERGFSFRKEAPLDMRMDINQKLTAYDIVNEYKEEDLENIFKNYGEEKFSGRIAKRIVEERKKIIIRTTTELRNLIIEILPKSYLRNLKIDPATKIFQALRIEVNGELEALGGFLPQALRILKKGGRIAIISFHSLEDRIVKDFFKEEAKGCICPREFPICRCGRKSQLSIITKKPVTGRETEIRKNPRSRSAKLRVAEKIQ